jgi:hypothetical protein
MQCGGRGVYDCGSLRWNPTLEDVLADVASHHPRSMKLVFTPTS